MNEYFFGNGPASFVDVQCQSTLDYAISNDHLRYGGTFLLDLSAIWGAMGRERICRLMCGLVRNFDRFELDSDS